MSTDLANKFLKHSLTASPAFGRTRGAPGGIDELNLHWTDNFQMTQKPGEQLVARWFCAPIQAFVAVAPDGRPLAPAAGATEEDLDDLTRNGAKHIDAFGGVGVVDLTNQRLVGTIGEGMSVLGPVDSAGDDVVAFALELSQIVAVDLMRKKGLFGKRETGIMVSTRADGHLMMCATHVAGGGGARQTNSAFAHEVVAATVAVLRPTATSGLRDVLDRAEAGHWDVDGDDLSAVLVERRS